jgi:hypothetical protein
MAIAGSERFAAGLPPRRVSSTGSSVFRNVDINLGSKGDGVEDGVDTIGKSVRRGVKRVPCDGCDVMHQGSLRPGERLEGAVDDGRGVLRGAKNEASHGGLSMLDDVTAGMVGVGSKRWQRVERLPHCCSSRTTQGRTGAIMPGSPSVTQWHTWA